MDLHDLLANLAPLPDAATIAESERIYREERRARCIAVASEAVAGSLAEAWRHAHEWERVGGVRVKRQREALEEDIAADVCAAIQAALPPGFVVSVESSDNTGVWFELTYRRAE